MASEDLYVKSIDACLCSYPYLSGYCQCSNMSKKSLHIYLNRIVQYIQFLESYHHVRIQCIEELADFDIDWIRDFMSGSSSSNKSKHYALKSLFNYLGLEKNPMAFIKPDRVEKKVDCSILSDEDVKRIRRHLKSNLGYLCIFDLMLYTGIRLSEIVNIRMEDVKQDQIVMDKDRVVVLSKRLKKELDEWILVRENFEYLFMNRNHRQVSVRSYEKILENGPVRTNPQMIRDTYAYTSLAKKVPILVSSRQMGISVSSFANKYLK